jgi:hypothetical protein
MRIKQIWDQHGFIILFVSIVIFFIAYWLVETRFAPHGTYSRSYYYDPETKTILPSLQPQKSKKSPSSTSKGEQICKVHIERKTGLPFQKCRPPFLYNEVTSENLELDLYNSDLKLAIEYNGRQHYEFIPFFHQTRDKFQTQKYRDKMKYDLCQKHGITLIVVPYTVPESKIEAYIDEQLERHGVRLTSSSYSS